MARLRHTLLYDLLFKKMFVDHPGLLKDLVSRLMGISLESIGEFSVTNAEIPPEALGLKHCRLDVNMKVGGRRVALEVQAEDRGDFPERTLYYWAKDYASALASGRGYLELPQTSILCIILRLLSVKTQRKRRIQVHS